jgi:acetyl esterase/lipase
MTRSLRGLERGESPRQRTRPLADGATPRIEHRAESSPLAPLLKRTHGDLVRAVVSACNLIPGVFVFPVDVARVKGFKRTLGMPGTSDVLGWWQPPMRTPRCEWCNALRPVSVAFECKVGRDRLRPEQRAFLDKLRAAGGIAAEIRSADQAVNLLTSRR